MSRSTAPPVTSRSVSRGARGRAPFSSVPATAVYPVLPTGQDGAGRTGWPVPILTQGKSTQTRDSRSARCCGMERTHHPSASPLTVATAWCQACVGCVQLPTGAARGPSFPTALGHLHTHVHTPEVAVGWGRTNGVKSNGQEPLLTPDRESWVGHEPAWKTPGHGLAAPSSGQRHHSALHSLSLLDNLTNHPPMSHRPCCGGHAAPSGTSGRHTAAGP